MERIWLKSYPAGVPAEVDYKQYQSVGDLVDKKVVEFGARPAFHCMGKTISFADLDRLTRAFGAWLQSKGYGKGVRVAIMMPNCLQYPVALYGTLRAGGIVVNVNPLYTPRELEHQLKDSGAEVIVILENFAHTLEEVLPRTPVKHVVVAALGDMLGLKGLIVNFVVRNVKKMVPAFELPDATRFNDLLAEGAGKALKPVAVGHVAQQVGREHDPRHDVPAQPLPTVVPQQSQARQAFREHAHPPSWMPGALPIGAAA